jgi:hypothetical protein
MLTILAPEQKSFWWVATVSSSNVNWQSLGSDTYEIDSRKVPDKLIGRGCQDGKRILWG